METAEYTGRFILKARLHAVLSFLVAGKLTNRSEAVKFYQMSFF